MKRSMFKLAFAVSAILMAGTASAGIGWTTGSWNLDSWAPGPNNVLAGLSLTAEGTSIIGTDPNNEGVGDSSKLTDGAVPTIQAKAGYGAMCMIGTGNTLVYTLTDPADIREIRVYTLWGDGGRDYIRLYGVDYRTADSDWIAIPNCDLPAYQNEYDTFRNRASLADSDGGVIAPGAVALRFRFGTQENGSCGYAEIEALAVSADPSGRLVLQHRGTDVVTFRGVAADFGAGAAGADFYFAYGTSPDGLVPAKQGATITVPDGGADASLTGLSANSTYYYAYYFENDQGRQSATQTGTFTTAAIVPIAAGEWLTVPDGDYATVAAGTTTAIPGFTCDGTITVEDGAALTDDQADGGVSYLGSAKDREAHLVIGENATVRATASDSWAALAVGQNGASGYVTVGAGSLLDCNGRPLVLANNGSDQNRAYMSYGRLDIHGTVRASLLQADGYWPTSTLTVEPLERPLASEVFVYDGGTLECGSYAVYDSARCDLTLAGGTLRITAGGDQFFNPSDSKATMVLVFQEGTVSTIDVGSNDVVLKRPKNNALSGGSADRNSLYVQGSGKLVKLGSGTLTFAEDFYENGFTGDIEVVEGRVALNHPIAEGQSVYVHDGAGYTVYADTDRARITYETEPLDKSRYDVNADAPNGIALAGSPYFYDTVLGGPTSAKTVTVSGTVTHGEVSDDAPFTLHGNEEGSTTVLDNTGLEALPLLLDGAGTFAFTGDRAVTAADRGRIAFAEGSTANYRQRGTFTFTGFEWDYPVARVSADRLWIGDAAVFSAGSRQSTPYRYYRLQFDKVGDGTSTGLQITEVELFDVDGLIDASGATASASNPMADRHPAENAFDRNFTNKYFDNNANTDNCWLQIDFGADQGRAVTAYRWMTGDDNAKWQGRNPTAWRLLGSDDGESWTLLDSRVNQPLMNENNAYTSMFLVQDPTESIIGTDVVVAEGGTLNVLNGTASVNSLTGAGTVNVAEGATLAVDSSDIVTVPMQGGVAGAGGFAKHGASLLRSTGVNTYAGDTLVEGGCYVVGGATTAVRYYRLVIDDAGHNDDHCTQLTRFALFDAAGVDQALDLVRKGVGTDATRLDPGEFYVGADYRNYNNSWNDVFRDNDTKWCGGNGNGGPGNTSVGDGTFTITLRLADQANEVVAYNFRTGGDDKSYPERSLRGWTLYGSADGENWTQLDSQRGFPPVGKNNTWYNDGCAFPCAYPAPGANLATDRTIPAASVVEVAPGARLKVDTAMTLSAIRLDFDYAGAENPCFDGLKMADKGALYLTSSRTAAEILTSEVIDGVPLHLSNLGTAARWTVYVNGRRTPYSLVPVEGDGTSYLKKEQGLVVLLF